MPEPEPLRCRCWRHEVTGLRCARCDTPICPNCSVSAPAGFICKPCAAPKNMAMLQVSPGHAGLSFFVGFMVASAAGYLLGSLHAFGFFMLWGGFLFGGFMGELVLRVSGRKRGLLMEITAGACTALGLGAGCIVYASSLAQSFAPGMPAPVTFLMPGPIQLLTIGIAVFAAVTRIRYL